MTPIKTYRIGNRLLEIFADLDSDPRYFGSNETKIWCTSNCGWILSDSEFSSTLSFDEIKERVDEMNNFYVSPLFFYEDEHELSTKEKYAIKPVGFIFIENEIENPEEVVDFELKLYNQHLSGDVYSYRLSEDIDSCGGFFGRDLLKNGMSDHLPKEFIERIKNDCIF